MTVKKSHIFVSATGKKNTLEPNAFHIEGYFPFVPVMVWRVQVFTAIERSWSPSQPTWLTGLVIIFSYCYEFFVCLFCECFSLSSAADNATPKLSSHVRFKVAY